MKYIIIEEYKKINDVKVIYFSNNIKNVTDKFESLRKRFENENGYFTTGEYSFSTENINFQLINTSEALFQTL